MPFISGQSGNPNGRNLERIASEALRVSVLGVITKGKYKGFTKLRRVCDVITKCAMDGEPWACGMVFDRLEGKPLQSVDTTVTHEAGQVFVELLRAINDARQEGLKPLPLIEAVREPAE